MGLYENIKMACSERGISINKLETELELPRSSISKYNKNSPSIDKIQKIADFLDFPIDYFTTGKKKEIALTPKDERDIKKDLDRIMNEIHRKDNGPLYYNGVEISEASSNLLSNAIEFALKETKLENKVKYNPNKNKSR